MSSMNRTIWLTTPSTYNQPFMDTTSSTLSHSHNHTSMRCQDTLAWILATLSIYICVSASLQYGLYGDSRLLLGPSSSRLIKSTSIFVEQVEVTNDYYKNKNNNDDDDDDGSDIMLYAFNKKPELSSQINWTTSKSLVLAAYSRKGISLWLNKGSSINMRWEAQASSINKLEGIVIKGGRKVEKLHPKERIIPYEIDVRDSDNDKDKEAEYIVEEDDRYNIGILNMNARNIILTMNLNVSAKIYDTTKAKKMCSTRKKGSCRLGLFFPITYYVILTTPKNGDDDGWFVEISFMARVVTYIVLLGVFTIVIFLIIKCLGAYDGENQNTGMIVAAQEATETEPLTRVQFDPMTYGTIKFHKKESDASSSSSEELYDEKLCIICYDEQRNCFFVPCGHCATCYDCAQRIVDGERKVCPVCRRLIHKVRRLFNS